MAKPDAIVVFGDSHVFAIKAAVKMAQREDVVTRATSGQLLQRPFASEKDGRVRVRFRSRDKFNPFSLTLNPEGLYVFSGPLHTAHLVRHRGWRAHCPLPDWPDNPSALPVTEDEIAVFCDRRQKNIMAFLEMAVRHDIRIAAIEPPRLMRRVRDLWERDPASIGPVDRIVRRHLKRRLREIGVTVLETPPHTYDGFWTKDEFAGVNESDAHHGNVDYGAAMLKQIDAWAASHKTPAPAWKSLFRRRPAPSAARAHEAPLRTE